MKITIAGIGYVGTSMAVLLSTKHKVICYDIDNKKLNLIKKRKSPIEDPEIDNFFKTKKLDLSATNSPKIAFKDSDFTVICTPTNYDPSTNQFNTSSIERVINEVLRNNNNGVPIIIKSTISVIIQKVRKIFSYKI